jgi:hypothetical protein
VHQVARGVRHRLAQQPAQHRAQLVEGTLAVRCGGLLRHRRRGRVAVEDLALTIGQQHHRRQVVEDADQRLRRPQHRGLTCPRTCTHTEHRAHFLEDSPT